MPCVKSAAKGSAHAQIAAILHGAGEEARIEQVQDRVLDAADILVDGQPVIGRSSRSSGSLRMRRAEAGEIPGAVDESVAGVGFARGRAAAAWALDVLPVRMPVERVARLVEGDIGWQPHRQILVRHGHDAALRAMDHRDRAAPIALARDAPIAQAEGGLLLAHVPLAEPLCDFLLRVLDGHAVQE